MKLVARIKSLFAREQPEHLRRGDHLSAREAVRARVSVGQKELVS